MNTTTLPHQIYKTLMMEAKGRLLAAEKVSKSSTPVTGLQALDIEFCFLQIRRILEAITFSAMVRESQRYYKIRELQHQDNCKDHGNPSKDWNAKDILKRLVSLSAYTLPIPIARANLQKSGITNFERHKISVNHAYLIEMYNICGGFLHGNNPFVADYVALINSEKKEYEEAPVKVQRALKFLRKLLWCHIVVQLDWSDPNNPQCPDNPKSAWIVDFGADCNQDVTIILADAI